MMNHLQIPAGSGEGMSVDFDIAFFAAAFKFTILNTTYALKALEQEGLINFNEVFFKPSTVLFTTTKQELEAFEQAHPALEPLIKGLLRSYEGIFDFPSTIYEFQLAKFLQVKADEVISTLHKLHQFGVINYTLQKDRSQIFLLQNRMYADSFTIDLNNLLKRKEKFEGRIKAMLQYISETVVCRSKFIAGYFNDDSVKACGICDNCINLKETALSKSEFDAIAQLLFEEIKANPIDINSLLAKITIFKKEKIWEVLNFLQGEKKLYVDKEGLLKCV